jgi:acetyl-CoA C-acetyltransferase
MTSRNSNPAYSGRPVYVVDGCRTPFLKSTGQPGPFRASDLAVAAGRQLLLRQPFEADRLDEVILGCVMPGPDEVNIGRVAALRMGCPDTVTAWTVQRNCASGMQALDSAASNITSGRSDLVLAGGTEAMSHAPLLLKPDMVGWLAGWQKQRGFINRGKQLSRIKPSMLAPIIGLLRGLTDPTVGLSMGQTAEILAQRFAISRDHMDAFALASHIKLARAQNEQWLDEVVPVIANDGTVYEADNGLRGDSQFQQLAKLRPVFERHGLVTAGNSAQVTDGAAWLLLASERAVNDYQLPVLGQILDCQWSGLDPSQMGLGPAYASAALLKRCDLRIDDIDFWEINEAFAAQVLACLAAMQDSDFSREQLDFDAALGKLPPVRLNVDGGAIAIGHPVGASGARIVLHLLKVLERQQAKTGIATLCIGGGQGGAMLVSSAGDKS